MKLNFLNPIIKDMFYLSYTKDDDESYKIAVVRAKGKKNKYIYINEKVRANGETKMLFDPDLFDVNDKKSKYGVFPIFDEIKNQNHRIFISGASGSGKSTFISQVLPQMVKTKQMEETDVDNIPTLGQTISDEIIIFSAVSSDEALDTVFNEKIPIRIDISSPNIMNIKPNNFVNCILIFDDIENYSRDSKVKKFLNEFRNECLEVSRHHQTDIITVSHKTLAGSKNEKSKTESTAYVTFPRHNQFKDSSSFLKSYIGVKDDQIDYILKKVPEEYYSRYVLVSKRMPLCLVHRCGVELLT